MNTMIDIFTTIFNILANKQVLLCTQMIAFTVIMSIGFLLIQTYVKHRNFTNNHDHAFYLLLFIIMSKAIEIFAWIFKLSHEFGYITCDYTYVQYFTLVSWVVDIIHYQAFGLFIENILHHKFILRWYQKLFIIINILFSIIFLHSGLYYIWHQPSFISIHAMYRIASISRILFIIPSFIIAFKAIHRTNIPSILKKQLNIFLKYIILPLVISDLIQSIPFYSKTGAAADATGVIALICVIFMTITIIFCARNLIQFRLFNFSKKVQAYKTSHTSFSGNFKDALEYLSLATTPQEVIYITQTFFKENFNIPIENICLSFRYTQEICTSGIDNYCGIASNIIELFLNKDNNVTPLLRQYRILVTDEIVFDAYYNNNPHELELVEFLHTINSEIFLPMYDKNTIIAYLTIKRSEQHRFYDLADQNKIIIFGTYLASAINIMHNSNTAALLHENKKIKEELYLKHQEVNQYKDSIKDILKQKINSQVGILLYKDDRFTIGNEAAQNLLGINVNQQRKHPLAIAIIKLAQQVESFRTLQTRFVLDNYAKQMVVTGVPHLDYQGGVIITIHHADTTDIIKKHIDKLKDPSNLDYLLYLETTKTGKIINQIIPSNNEALLNFKIKLLQVALHKKAVLLQSHQDDLLTIAEIIHTISLRTTLHLLDIKPTSSMHDVAIKIFGLNPLLAFAEQEEALLKKLDQQGTLLIKNVEFLDLENQNKLADFIRYGIFTLIKSEQNIASDVRIICSVNENPQTLINQHKLSPLLYNQLIETTLTMPSLSTMEEEELHLLIDDIGYQAVQKNQFSSLLQISKKDKQELLEDRPKSLHGFKIKIQELLQQKSKDYHIFHETHVHQEIETHNPKLAKAATLGKHALKDREMMTMLWEEFRCQNKIAQFIGVNRSSVQRRCKEYNLY